jgi:hypothetical protein
MPLTTSSATCPQTSIASSSTIIGLKTPPAPLASSSLHHSSDHILSLMALTDDLSELVPHLPGIGIRISRALFRREEEYEMDLWVVKYASRRSRIGDFSGDSSVRGARIRGVFACHASAGGEDLGVTGGCSMAAIVTISQEVGIVAIARPAVLRPVAIVAGTVGPAIDLQIRRLVAVPGGSRNPGNSFRSPL